MKTLLSSLALPLIAIGLSLAPAYSQTSAPASDAQALALARQAIAVLTGGASVADVALNGNVRMNRGSDTVAGSVLFRAKGAAQSRVDFSFAGSKRTEIRKSIASPSGVWTDPDGTVYAYSPSNCWTDPVWFFPALSSLGVNDPSLIFHYVGSESRGQASLQHIRVYRYVDGIAPGVAADIQKLSMTDYFLDSASSLPVEMDFNVHPDDESGTNVPIVVTFSGYQPINGVQVPTRVQQHLNGALALDFTITGANVNAGVGDDVFSLP